MHNCSGISPQGNDLHNIYQIDGQAIEVNDSELYMLVKKTTEMINSGEKKSHHGTGDIPVRAGLVKSLLMGVAVLTGIGALAVCGYYYVAGRQRSGSLDSGLPARILLPSVANIMPGEINSHPSISPENTLIVITDPSLIIETTSSPYSYYEDIYGRTASLNNIPVTTTGSSVTATGKPVITTKKPGLITTGRSTSAYMAVKPTTISSPDSDETAVTEYKHESERFIYYRTVHYKYNYPLGTKFFNELLAFCFANTRYEIEQACLGTPELRCKLLDDINNKIESFKQHETLVRRINAAKKRLSVKEHGDEIMLRRQLATLYLAAESIINKKNFDVFLHEVNRDYKHHSTKGLKQREEKIMNYFPQEC